MKLHLLRGILLVSPLLSNTDMVEGEMDSGQAL
jgi:hypothetical protein